MRDILIIKKLREGDKGAFDYVFNYYYSSLCVFALQYIKDKDIVEDIVQEFFLSFWLEIEQLQINHSLKTYLFACVKNRCLDHQKHQKVVEKYKSYILFAESETDNSFEHVLVETDLHQMLKNAFSKLPPRCREIFELSRNKGLSNQEISDRLGISKRTVELQISNSLKILRAELAEYLPLCLLTLLLK